MALTSTQVHNVTVAMFGAAAGGYTEELQAFESQSALVDFLATLDLFDTTFPQTTNIGFANALVEQMAASATDAGKEEAVDLIMGALADGMSKAWVINWAIEGLLATTSAAFADAKADFIASVEGAVAFSAANADVTVVADLQAGVAATAADLALTAALDAYAAAQVALDDNVEAWGLAQTTVQKDLDGSDASKVYDAVFTAEAALKAAAAKLTADGQANLDDTTETNASYKTYATGDAAEDAALTVVETSITAVKSGLDAALTKAETALEAYDTTDTAGSLQKLVDTYVGTVDAQAAAVKAEAAAEVSLAEAVAKAAVNLDFDLDTAKTDTAAAKDYSFDVTSVADTGVATFDGTVGTDNFGSYQATYDATTNKTSWTLNGGAALTAAQIADDAMLQKLLANADVQAVLAAAANDKETDAALTAAGTAITDALTAIKAKELATDKDGLVNAGKTALTAAGEADAYVTALDNLDTYAEVKASYDKALAAVNDARADAAETAAAQKALADADAAIQNATDATVPGLGVTLVDISLPANKDFGLAVKDEVAVFTAATTAGNNAVANFGAAGTDSIYFGEEYSLVEVDADAETQGDVAALEVLWEQDGANLILYIEEEAFAGQSSTAFAANDDITMITLTGVDAADVTFANGYLSVSA